MYIIPIDKDEKMINQRNKRCDIRGSHSCMVFKQRVTLCIPVFCMILFTFLLISCDQPQQENNRNLLTWEFFQKHLMKDMDYQAIVAKFGEPDRDVGSGIHIYVYDLKDSSEIWIGYVEKIFYARHVDKNHNILHTII